MLTLRCYLTSGQDSNQTNIPKPHLATSAICLNLIFQKIFFVFHSKICLCLCMFQAMITKLKSQLDAAQKAKEIHAARKKVQEMAKSNQVCIYYVSYSHCLTNRTRVHEGKQNIRNIRCYIILFMNV